MFKHRQNSVEQALNENPQLKSFRYPGSHPLISVVSFGISNTVHTFNRPETCPHFAQYKPYGDPLKCSLTYRPKRDWLPLGGGQEEAPECPHVSGVLVSI